MIMNCAKCSVHVMISANCYDLFSTYKECPHGWEEFIGTASCYRFYRFPRETYTGAAARCPVG